MSRRERVSEVMVYLENLCGNHNVWDSLCEYKGAYLGIYKDVQKSQLKGISSGDVSSENFETGGITENLIVDSEGMLSPDDAEKIMMSKDRKPVFGVFRFFGMAHADLRCRILMSLRV
jgi:hypothetical protein